MFVVDVWLGLGRLTLFVDGTSMEDQGFTEKLMATIVNNIQVSGTDTGEELVAQSESGIKITWLALVREKSGDFVLGQGNLRF